MSRPPAEVDRKYKQGASLERSHSSDANSYLHASLLLHQHLVGTHWTGQALIGPDPGIRFAYRIGRVIKSGSPWFSWRDDLHYLQAQAYWVLGNWRLFSLTGNQVYRDIAIACSDGMLDRQRPDGAWDYPHPEWRGRVAATEGIWASIGLLETYRKTKDHRYLAGAQQWYRYLTEHIGFQGTAGDLSVNYFASHRRSRVLNVSIDVLRLLAELGNITGDERFLTNCAGLLNFVETSQKDTGELPYAVTPEYSTNDDRPNFQCFKYNAFSAIGLARYFELSNNAQAYAILRGIVKFVGRGLDHDGRPYYDCNTRYRHVVYHATAIGAALFHAKRLGIDIDQGRMERAYQFVVSRQREDGSFPYSRGDYRLLSDGRSYPRYLAMILTHLLLASPSAEDDPYTR